MSHQKSKNSSPSRQQRDSMLNDATYDVHQLLENFWVSQTNKIESLPSSAFRDQHHAQELPLARIKKIMKLDDDVKNQMISAEAPVLFAKAAEMFIEELTLKSWVHTEDNKRKTLQKNDIAMAITKYDQFDFLIDIVPREEIKTTTNSNAKQKPNDVQFSTFPTSTNVITTPTTSVQGSDRHFYVQVGNNGTPSAQPVQIQNGQFIQATTPLGQPVQLITGPGGELQLVQQQQAPPPPQEPMPQVFQQIVSPDGTVQHVPLQLSPAQLQFLKAQFGQQQQQQQQRATTAQSTQQQPAIFLQTTTSNTESSK